MPAAADDSENPLTAAYEQRTQQVYEARGALAEAVSALTSELAQRRRELESLRDEQRARDEYVQSLQEEASKQRERAVVLEAELKGMHERGARLSRGLKSVDSLRPVGYVAQLTVGNYSA